MSARGGDPAWVVWLSLAGLAAVIVGGTVAAVRYMPAIDWSKAAEDETDRLILADADAAPVARAMRDGFNEDYLVFKRTLAYKQRIEPEPSEIRDEIQHFTRQAFGQHGGELSQAPHDKLAAFRTAEQKLLERLGTIDPDRCAEYVVRRTTSYPIEDAEARKLQAASSAAFWTAAAAGRDKPAQRETVLLDDKDAELFVKALIEAGMPRADVDRLDRIGEFPEAKQCDLGMQRMRALERMPAEASDRVYAWMLTGS
jgi:hypothetical protein